MKGQLDAHSFSAVANCFGNKSPKNRPSHYGGRWRGHVVCPAAEDGGLNAAAGVFKGNMTEEPSRPEVVDHVQIFSSAFFT